MKLTYLTYMCGTISRVRFFAPTKFRLYEICLSRCETAKFRLTSENSQAFNEIFVANFRRIFATAENYGRNSANFALTIFVQYWQLLLWIQEAQNSKAVLLIDFALVINLKPHLMSNANEWACDAKYYAHVKQCNAEMTNGNEEL